MNLIEDIVSQGHGSLDADYICIHETANPGATARNHRDLWARDDEYAVHYTADWTGDVYHCVPDDCLCWQVGNGNAHVIGIELCHAENQDYFDAVWRTGVEWARWILAAHGWGTDRLISHDMARQMWGGTDHTDPVGYFGEFGKSWEDFVNDVENGETEVTDGEMNTLCEKIWNSWHFDGMSNPFYVLYYKLVDAETQIAALTEAVKALATAQGADPDTIAKAVSDAVSAKLATIDIQVTTK